VEYEWDPAKGRVNFKKHGVMKREYDFSKAKRGPVIRVPKGQTRITIPVDDHVLDWFRRQVDEAGGGDYQTLINAALRSYVQRAEEPIEETLRRVIREEMRRAS
jgi:uncharacterized protein (DUF4415 family)